VAGDEFRYDIARFAERTIVGVQGSLDAASAADFERDVADMLGPPLRGIVLDLNYCPFVDSSGAKALARLRDRAADRRIAFQLTSVPVSVQHTLGSYGFFGRAKAS
jgi:anti-anti-sigma factor